MFTGIVEATGTVEALEQDGGNLHLTLSAPFAAELKIDQSLAHNGVCLTVVRCDDKKYTVTAVSETLQKTNLGNLKTGDAVNLERCMRMGDRLDGHIVQGHVDLTGTCTQVEVLDGSWKFHFTYDAASGHVTVPKGSICVNGTSLTVVDSSPGSFSVVIIPYTFEHTVFRTLKTGDAVNLEFDVIGKYVAALLQR